MNKEQRDALRSLAEEATPGPWWHGECTPPDVHALAWIGQSFVDCEGGQKNYAAPSRDAEYIASANPSTILQLLDYIETLEKDAARYRWLRHSAWYVGPEPSAEYCAFIEYTDYNGCDSDGNPALDEAIDAAMQGETE